MSVHTASTAARWRASRHVVTSVRRLLSLRSFAKPITSPRTKSESTVQNLLALAAMDFIGTQMARPVAGPRAIPVGEKGRLRPSRFTPTHAMPDRRVTRRHRLTIQADLLPQAPRHARLWICEVNPLGADPTVSTPEPPLSIDQRHRMGGPRHIVPGPIPDGSHATHAATAATARIPAQAPPLNPGSSTDRPTPRCRCPP